MRSYFAENSPANFKKTDEYPKDWEKRVPKRVRVTKTVKPRNLSTYKDRQIPVAFAGKEYDAYVQITGTLCAIIGERLLHLESDEFEIIMWHD